MAYQPQQRINVNGRIRAREVRVILASTKEQLGIMRTSDALRRANQLGLDLVEIAPNANPPVCQIVDYGKFRYEMSKQDKDKKQNTARMKEVKFRVNIDAHDYLTKLRRAETFLDKGSKLKIQLQFRGREMAHQELGEQLVRRVRDDLAGMSQVEAEPRKAGRSINMMLAPLPANRRKRKFAIMSEEEADAHEADEPEEDDDHHDAAGGKKRPLPSDDGQVHRPTEAGSIRGLRVGRGSVPLPAPRQAKTPVIAPRRLLLFDIDGTLLTTGGAGEGGFCEAFEACFDIADDLSTIDFAGATDTGVIRLLFDKHGLPPTPENHARFKAAYLPRLAANLTRFPGRLMPGVLALLADLRAAAPTHGLAMGLLTGNFRAAAELKLTHFGLEKFFNWEFSAFADDHPDRDQLGPVVLGRARNHHGVEAFQDHARDVLVLGDTPRDIGCARACGASVLAVATGRHGRAALAGARPDFLFDTLADAGVREALLG